MVGAVRTALCVPGRVAACLSRSVTAAVAGALLCAVAAATAHAQESAPSAVTVTAPDGSWSVLVHDAWRRMDAAALASTTPSADAGWDVPGRDGGPDLVAVAYTFAYVDSVIDRTDLTDDELREVALDDLRESEARNVPVALRQVRSERAGTVTLESEVIRPDGTTVGQIVLFLAERRAIRALVVAGPGPDVAARRDEVLGILRGVRFERLPEPDPARRTAVLVAVAAGFAVALALAFRGVVRDVRAVRTARAEEPLPVAGPIPCPNCGGEVAERFCPGCGQRRIAGRLRLGEVLSEWLAKFLDLESGFAGTFVGLTLRPATVVREYLAGRRASYCAPVRYYMTWFVIAALAGWGARHRPDHVAAQLDTLLTFAPGLARAGGREAVAALDELERWLGGPALTLLIAALSSRVFRRTGWTYAEHLAATFFVLGHEMVFDSADLLLRWGGHGIAGEWIANAGLVWSLGVLAAIHAPGQGWRAAILRTLLVAALALGAGVVLAVATYGTAAALSG
jgi:hypothetical protein